MTDTSDKFSADHACKGFPATLYAIVDPPGDLRVTWLCPSLDKLVVGLLRLASCIQWCDDAVPHHKSSKWVFSYQ